MTKTGLQVATLFGKNLPTFSTQHEAEETLLGFRDTRLRLIRDISTLAPEFATDYTPDSLKELEKLYFRLWEANSFAEHGITIEVFEECMAMYFGEVMVRNIPGAKWVVQDYAFEKGKFELGVERGLLTVMLRQMKNHHETKSNNRRQAIYRKYKQYAT
jgi:hypothetical protein